MYVYIYGWYSKTITHNSAALVAPGPVRCVMLTSRKDISTTSEFIYNVAVVIDS